MKLKMSGVVADYGDDCRVYGQDRSGVWIGEHSVTDKIEDLFGGSSLMIARKQVTIAILRGKEVKLREDGEIDVMTGYGYSEYTPIDHDKVKLGERDILNHLRDLVGQEITMWVADEPIDLMGD